MASDTGTPAPFPNRSRPKRPAGDWFLAGLTIVVVTAILCATVWVTVRPPASEASASDAPTLIAEAVPETTTTTGAVTTTTATPAPAAARRAARGSARQRIVIRGSLAASAPA